MKILPRGWLLVGGMLLLLAARPVAGEENAGDLYRAAEFSVDVFGSGSLARYTLDNISRARVRQDTRLGAGAGANYFFTRNFGIGADAYSEDTHAALIDSASVSFICRHPVGHSGFAPYVFGGGGRHFENVRAWFLQVGVGVEYRFARNIGVFLDARGVLPDETRYYGVGRLGMRFTF